MQLPYGEVCELRDKLEAFSTRLAERLSDGKIDHYIYKRIEIPRVRLQEDMEHLQAVLDDLSNLIRQNRRID